MLATGSRIPHPRSKYTSISSSATVSQPASQIDRPPDAYLKVLCLNGRLKEALCEMALLGTEVRFRGYDVIVIECVNRRVLREGQLVHAHMIKTRYQPPVYLDTRLLIMYDKCGELDDAQEMFDGMSERNIVSWTAMISAYSQRGCQSVAVELFRWMLRTGLLPNEFTLATVFASCIGSRGVDIGRQIHVLSIKSNYESHMYVGSSLLNMYAKSSEIHNARMVFKVLPERDVVSCTSIISGYAQLGLDEESLEMFQKLHKQGMECNYVTFTSLLTALAGLAALDYDAGRWEDVVRVRGMMKEKAVMKEPERSCINLNKTVHAFHSGDLSHPQKDKVHAKVRELYEKIREFGFSPDLSCVLHDVDDEQKERILVCHSEKLAIAFGLIVSPRGGILRVTKNLRICVDCQNFAKHVSKATKRELSLRDSKRFHLFVNGACSCGDFW